MKYILIITTLFVLISCSNPTEENGYFYIGSDIPVIKGIIITGEDSPEPFGLLGVPNEKSKIEFKSNDTNEFGSAIPNTTAIYSPFPNPFNFSTQIAFSLNRKAHVKVWIVLGKLDESVKELKPFYSNSYSVNTNNTNSNNVLLDRTLVPGTYMQIFEANNYQNGVYRVYMQVDDELMWRNLLIYNNY